MSDTTSPDVDPIIDAESRQRAQRLADQINARGFDRPGWLPFVVERDEKAVHLCGPERWEYTYRVVSRMEGHPNARVQQVMGCMVGYAAEWGVYTHRSYGAPWRDLRRALTTARRWVERKVDG